MRHTYVNEMADSRSHGGGACGAHGRKIDTTKLFRFGRAWMRDAHQMNERYRRRHSRGVAGGVQSVPYYRHASSGKIGRRRRANERADLMAARHELGNQAASHVAGAARHKHVHSFIIFSSRFSFDRSSSLASAI
jgi:hypothetical protein